MQLKDACAIKTILSSPDKTSEIEKYLYRNSLKIQQLHSAADCMERLITNYDIEREFACYTSILEFLDQAELHVPPALSNYFRTAFAYCCS